MITHLFLISPDDRAAERMRVSSMEDAERPSSSASRSNSFLVSGEMVKFIRFLLVSFFAANVVSVDKVCILCGQI